MAAAKRALVIGAGVGGLASAAMLERAGWRVVVRASQSTAASFDDALGIWSPALAAIRSWLGPDVGDELEAAGRYVRDVDGYHDGRGRRLCGPSAPLGDGRDERPALLFVPRSALLRALRGACGRGVSFAEAEGGLDIPQLAEEGSAQVAPVPGASCWDLLVGADGADSAVRAALRPGAAGPVDWGFHVYRGVAVAPAPLLPHGRSFQAWSTRAQRFAAVPTAVPARGVGADLAAVAWFATARGPPPPDAERSVAGARSAVRALASAHFAPYAAQLVDATADAHLCPPARARAHRVGPFGPRAAPRASRAPTAAGGSVAVALVGDAAWTLDPILAQGAGVAIEDAAALAGATAGWARAHGGAALDAALAEYGEGRRPRLAALAAVSLLPDLLGQMSGAPAALRDRLLAATPRALSSAVFEAALRLSLAPAPLSGRWRYSPPPPPRSEGHHHHS